MPKSYITATYRVPATPDLKKRAESIAVGMTVGSWTDLPEARQEHLRHFLGEVGDIVGEGVTARFDIRYPVDNVRPSISSLLTVIFGKLSLDGRIRLIHLDLPEAFTQHFPGPLLGSVGLREQLHVARRPLVMSIFKSENGRTLGEFREALEAQLAGGVDFVKDDEIYMHDIAAPLKERIQVARELIDARTAKTGQQGLYVSNLTGTPVEMLETAQEALTWGAQGFLVSPYTVGLDILTDLRRHGVNVPLIVHPAFAGAIASHDHHGVEPHILLGMLPRLAGGDVMLYPSPYGSVALPKPTALAVADALRNPGRHRAVMPGPSAGIHAGVLPELFRDFGSDVIINAGGAIHGHPSGTTAGARQLVEAAHGFVEASV